MQDEVQRKHSENSQSIVNDPFDYVIDILVNEEPL